jgi:hypothetical protein
VIKVEFHEGRTGTPHPPDLTTLRWEGYYEVVPRIDEGVTFPNGRHVVVVNVIHILAMRRGESYVVVDVEEHE